MEKLEFLKKMYDLMKPPNKDSLELSMGDTHHKGVFSLVIGGTDFGKLTRVFIANKKIKPFAVQLHTHRYPVRITAIKGNIKHYVANESDLLDKNSVQLSEFKYTSPLNGGDGLKYIKESNVEIKEHYLPVGSTVKLSNNDFHTMSCTKGSIWIVEELGFMSKSSKVLGVPFVTEGLYNEPKSFNINDNVQLVSREIKKLILDYELI